MFSGAPAPALAQSRGMFQTVMEIGTGWQAAGILLAVLLIAAMWSVIRRRARRRLALERDLFAAALDIGGAARLITSPQGRAIASTGAWRARGEVDPKRPIPRLADDLFADPDSVAELQRLAASAIGGETAHAELLLAAEAGRRQRISAFPLPGHPRWTVWELGGDGDRGGIEDAVRDGQHRLATFLEDGSVGVYSLDRDGRFQFVDETIADWLGSTPDEIVGGNRRLREFLARDCDFDADTLGEAARGEITLTDGDGNSFPAAFAQVVIANGAGTATRSILRNLSRSVNGAESDEVPLLRLSRTRRGARADGVDPWEERFRHLFLEAPAGIALVDADGTLRECNTAFRETLSVATDTTSGLNLAEIVRPADGATGIAAWLNSASGEHGAPDPLTVTPTGGEGTKFLFAHRLAQADDAEPGLVVYALDHGADGGFDEKLQQSQKMELVGQLAGGIAHDFNNLLTAMIGFCDLLLLRHSPKDQSFADIMQIKQNANRAANLVRQLLAFSRQQTLQPKVLHLTDVLAELSHLLRRLIGARIDLDMVHGRDFGLVKVDQGQFEQVVINLAVNARDAMTDGGTLTIATSAIPAGDPRLTQFADVPDGDYVTFEVADTGSGIPPELREKIFEPFFTTKGVGEGTGLGLATVYGIIKQTGGHIFVDSVPGEGTRFTILLPEHQPEEETEDEAAVAAEAKAAGDAEALRDTTGEGTVLLVEDEDAVRLFGARALRNKGYEVIEARNGEGALEVLGAQADSIDLLITDVVMPGVDGPTLIRKVREDHPDMKVIFISGYTEDTFRKNLDEGEVVHFLPKPFSLQQLAGKVKEVMHADGA